MRATIDKAGRVVLPKELRARVGLRPGPVDVHVEGAGLRLEAVTSSEELAEGPGGRPMIPASGTEGIDDEMVRELRDAERR